MNLLQNFHLAFRPIEYLYPVGLQTLQ